jgi:hypothetical protein
VCNSVVNQPINLSLVDFANLEELHVSVWITDNHLIPHAHPVLRSVTSPCLQRVIVELRERGTSLIQWSSLDETLVGLIERHKTYGNLELWISTGTDPERVRQHLPRVAQEGVLEVGPRKRPDF